ncbi:MAG: tetratricopeptide repeat protein [Turneriella sp.]
MPRQGAPFLRRYRIAIIVAALILTAGVGYAVFFPTLGIRQNLAEEEFQKAWLLFQDRKYDAAIEKLSQALNINPQFHWARRFLAQAYYFSGQKAEALTEYETLARAMPHDLTLRAHIESLSFMGEGTTPSELEFLRVVPRSQGYRYNRPTFVGSLHSDQLAVLSLGNFEIGNMVSYSAQGEPFENRHRVSGRLNYPMGFAQNEEEIWISDFKEDKIHRLNKNAKRYLSYFFNPQAIGKTGEGNLQFRSPAGICHRPGEFIIADSGNNRLQRIADNGQFIASITRPAGGDAMQTPFGVYCDNDAIWITESSAARITHFDRYGNIVEEFSPSELKKPRHITYDADLQQFMVADESAGVLFMDASGKILRKTAGYMNPGGRFVTFARPYAAAYDAFRNLYVADYGSSEVVQFSPVGEKFGQLYLRVEKVNSAKFPMLGVYVTVAVEPNAAQRSKGITNYLTELKAEDFKIMENDASVGNLGAEYLKQFDDVLQLTLLISRSTRMREYETQLPWVLDHILTRLREKDRVRLFSHGSDIRRESEFINSRLKLLQSVKQSLSEDALVPSAMPTLSAGLFDATTELLTREGKRILLYITDGEADDDQFTPYSKERLIEYARANHIAVYVVSFEHPQSVAVAGAKESLHELAEKTGGVYYRALDIDPQIESVMRRQKEVRYLLSYQSLARRDMRGQYIDLRVMARFRQRRGLELSGYFIP